MLAIGLAFESVYHSLSPTSTSFGRHLEDDSAAVVVKAISATAGVGRAVKVAGSVHNQTRPRKCSVRSAGKIVQYSFLACRIHLEHRPEAEFTSAPSRAIEIAMCVMDWSGPRTRSV